jgi:hypothetical protein
MADTSGTVIFPMALAQSMHSHAPILLGEEMPICNPIHECEQETHGIA